jgi:hypothetical protein
MQPKLRKAALVTHIGLAVGWIGAVLAYLVLVAGAIRTQDAQTLRYAWIAMEMIGRTLIVPLAFGALATGLVMSLGTPWGLFRHYWVAVSLALTIVATLVLVQHMETVRAFAALAASADATAIQALRDGLRGELLHAGLGLCVLIVIEVLNVLKPKGLTAYGRRKALEARRRPSPPASDATPPSPSTSVTPLWVRVIGLHAVGIAVLLVLALHIAGWPAHP